MEEKDRGIIINEVPKKCGLFCVSLRFLKWLTRTNLFAGFAITTMVIAFVIAFAIGVMLLGAFWTDDYSAFARIFTNVVQNWRKAIVIYIVFGFVFTLFTID